MMENVVRWRVPSHVRTLLLDIAPKQKDLLDWTKPKLESESVMRDSISVLEGTASEVLTTPGDSPEGVSLRTCGICLSTPSRYSCPRCNILYCSLRCYRSQEHRVCSEEFYQECVSEELKSHGRTGKEGHAQMQEVLLRLRSRDGGVEESNSGIMEQDAHALEMLNRLSGPEDNGVKEPKKVEEILQNLECFGNDDTDDGKDDITNKLSGLDIDSLTEEQLWNLLPTHHKEKFEELVWKGGIAGLVTQWTPWWESHKETMLIEELWSEEDTNVHASPGDSKIGDKWIKDTGNIPKNPEIIKDTLKVNEIPKDTANMTPKQFKVTKFHSQIKPGQINSCKTKNSPPITAKIPPLHSICRNPSPLIQFSVVNVLYSYAFSLCQFNGDISEPEQLLEFCWAVLHISESLGSGRVFTSLFEALEGAILATTTSSYSNKSDLEAPIRAVGAVAHILSGHSRDNPSGYALSALSQLKAALLEARASLSRDEQKDDWRRILFRAAKKCEFFQAWVRENADVIWTLAQWTWREYSMRREERERVESEKRQVEEEWKKGRGRGKVLIEEIK